MITNSLSSQSLPQSSVNDFDDLVTQNMLSARSSIQPTATELNKIKLQNIGSEKLAQFNLPASYNPQLPAISYKIGNYIQKGQQLENHMHSFVHAVENNHSPDQITRLGNLSLIANDKAEDAALLAEASIGKLVQQTRNDSEVDLFSHSDLTVFRNEITDKTNFYINNNHRIHALAQVAGLKLEDSATNEMPFNNL